MNIQNKQGITGGFLSLFIATIIILILIITFIFISGYRDLLEDISSDGTKTVEGTSIGVQDTKQYMKQEYQEETKKRREILKQYEQT
jgi:uncharacterized membrane protein